MPDDSAVVRVVNDILSQNDGGKVTVLVLLDLSAAFDTINHSILLKRLSSSIGVSGTALQWFSSYLSGRTQKVSCNGQLSSAAPLECGIPQGSVLGPLLFSIYTAPLGNIIRSRDVSFHFNADDTQ